MEKATITVTIRTDLLQRAKDKKISRSYALEVGLKALLGSPTREVIEEKVRELEDQLKIEKERLRDIIKEEEIKKERIGAEEEEKKRLDEMKIKIGEICRQFDVEVLDAKNSKDIDVSAKKYISKCPEAKFAITGKAERYKRIMSNGTWKYMIRDLGLRLKTRGE